MSKKQNKIEQVKSDFILEVELFKEYISKCFKKWGKNYQDSYEKTHRKICVIETGLLETIPNLSESELDALIKVTAIWSDYNNVPRLSRKMGFYGMCFVGTDNQEEFMRSIVGSNNTDFKQLAGVLQHSQLIYEDLPNVFARYCESFYRSCRFGSFWQKKKAETIMKRGNKCEICKTNKDLQVHHKKNWYSNADEELEVLCQTCHMTKRHGKL